MRGTPMRVRHFLMEFAPFVEFDMLGGLGWSQALRELFAIDFSIIEELSTYIITETMQIWIFANITDLLNPLQRLEISERLHTRKSIECVKRATTL